MQAKVARGVVGDIANFHAAQFRRATEVVVVRHQNGAGLRSVGRELEWTGAHRLIGKAFSAERLVGLLANDVATAVVGELRQEHGWPKRFRRNDLHGCVIDLFECEGRVIAGNARCIGIRRFLQREDNVIRRQRIRIGRAARMTHCISAQGERPRLSAVCLGHRFRHGGREIRLDHTGVTWLEPQQSVEDHVYHGAILGSGRKVRIEGRLVASVRGMHQNWPIFLR